ncbi:MAG: iron dicitrate transport regulator FecR [Flavobacteriales bacterium]|nr:iron dicitrate transport regulator FecR [Flavobacteriales bacterium]
MNSKLKDVLKKTLDNGRKITFLVGAGISAESGIPTFRGKDGYWVSGSKNYKAQEIGTFSMFQKASQEVWKWFLYRKSVTEFAKPNKSHFLLKDIECLLEDQFALVSQNVDGLHKKAGSSEARTFLIHGDFDFVRCGSECSSELYPFPTTIDLSKRDKHVITEKEWVLLRCPKCGDDLRPHVLWFDEYYNEKYYKRDTVLRISKNTGLLIIIGTSGATNLPQIIVENALSRGAFVVEVNIEKSLFSEHLIQKKNGQFVQNKSTPFLEEFYQELNEIMNARV